MRILVDADACPVKDIIVKYARDFNIPVIMYADINHIINDDYAEVVYVDHGRDSADFAIVNRLKKGDIVVTQDYGVAAMALSREAKAVNQNGMIYTQHNLDRLLLQRHMNRKIRNAGGKISGPAKRNKENDNGFVTSLKNLIICNSR